MKKKILPQKRVPRIQKKPSKKGTHLLQKLFLSLGSIFSLIFLFSTFSHSSSTPQSIPCANSITCAKNLTVQVENDTVGVFQNHPIVPPKIDLTADKNTPVLGDTTATGEKHIYVDLAKQTLYAYQGKTLFMQTLVSTGKWHPTPTGDFKIWIKLRATRMSGGAGEDYYNLPNVPYTMFFANDQVPRSAGFSLHGAYWHNNFGHPMSHGCVNMRIIDVEKLYNWANPETTGYTTYATDTNPGTTVTIYGEAPIN